jgi:hypothetical protein
MKPQSKIGRVDTLAEALLDKGVKSMPDPVFQIGARIFRPIVSQAITETFGPATGAGKFGLRLVSMMGEFQKNFEAARRAVERENGRR